MSLHNAIVHAKDFEPILVEDHSPPCPKRRYDYNHGLVVPIKCVKYSYTGSRNYLHSMWKMPTRCCGEVVTHLARALSVRDRFYQVMYACM